MPPLEEVRKKTLSLLTQEGLEGGMDYLYDQLKEGTPFKRDFISYRSQLADLNQRRNKNIIDPGQAQIQENIIREGVIDLVSSLLGTDLIGSEDVSLLSPPTLDDWQARRTYVEELLGKMNEEQIRRVLGEKIDQMNLYEDMGEIQLVNVNRKQHIDGVWDAFDDKETIDFQYYFLCACRQQMPQSLAERFVFELMHEELDEEMEALNYPRIPDSLRMDFEKWEFKNKLRRSWKKFKKMLEERFKDRFPELDLESFVKTGIPHMEERFVLTPLTFHESRWSDHAEAFFEQVMDTFTQADDKCPTFLFFFVIYLDKFESEPLTDQQTQIIQSVNRLIERNPAACSLHKGLTPVNTVDMISWFDKLGEDNREKVFSVLDTYVTGMVKSDTGSYWENRMLNMDLMEVLQEIVYKQKN